MQFSVLWVAIYQKLRTTDRWTTDSQNLRFRVRRRARTGLLESFSDCWISTHKFSEKFLHHKPINCHTLCIINISAKWPIMDAVVFKFCLTFECLVRNVFLFCFYLKFNDENIVTTIDNLFEISLSTILNLSCEFWATF